MCTTTVQLTAENGGVGGDPVYGVPVAHAPPDAAVLAEEHEQVLTVARLLEHRAVRRPLQVERLVHLHEEQGAASPEWHSRMLVVCTDTNWPKVPIETDMLGRLRNVMDLRVFFLEHAVSPTDLVG